jgi:hypothetical protein
MRYSSLQKLVRNLRLRAAQNKRGIAQRVTAAGNRNGLYFDESAVQLKRRQNKLKRCGIRVLDIFTRH